MLKFLLVFFPLFGILPAIATAQAAVRVEKADLKGSRPLEEQTASAVIHNYLQSWQTLQSALDQNRADLLDFRILSEMPEINSRAQFSSKQPWKSEPAIAIKLMTSRLSSTRPKDYRSS